MTGESSSSRPPPPQAPSNFLAPGFRFYPTDEELVVYYLKRKVSGLPILVDAIAEVDLYKAEPWDLPAKSRFHSRDMEWYFFTPLHRKRSTRARINRTTIKGYWKTTGKDRSVRHGLRVVGMKKTLVFHLGRAPCGERTDWVMHEYRLEDEELARSGILQEIGQQLKSVWMRRKKGMKLASIERRKSIPYLTLDFFFSSKLMETFVICKILYKGSIGLHNGARSSAFYLQKEWDGDNERSLNMVPVNENGNGGDALMYVSVDDYLELGELLEDLESGSQLEDVVHIEASSSVQIEDGNLEDPSTASQCEAPIDDNFLDGLLMEDFLVDD